MQETKQTSRREPEELPKRHVFMMGNGQPVPPKRSKAFCKSLVDGCLDAGVHGHYDFALGFAACLDAVARGTIDLEEHPVNVALQAWADINNITTTPNKVTNIMRLGDDR